MNALCAVGIAVSNVTRQSPAILASGKYWVLSGVTPHRHLVERSLTVEIEGPG
jgi:hypothetical protein